MSTKQKNQIFNLTYYSFGLHAFQGLYNRIVLNASGHHARLHSRMFLHAWVNNPVVGLAAPRSEHHVVMTTVYAARHLTPRFVDQRFCFSAYRFY